MKFLSRDSNMARPPNRIRPPESAKDAAEAMFKPAAKAPELPPRPAGLPGVRELVSLRIDQEVLDHFREDGPGWQDRINDALRALIKK